MRRIDQKFVVYIIQKRILIEGRNECMGIDYEFVDKLQATEVVEVFSKSGINRPVEDLKRIQRMIEFADLIVTARDNGKLVGIARALTDYSYCCYLSDLAVHEEYQRSGIGKELVSRIQEKLSDEVTLVLISAPNAVDYYPHIGFEKADKAFLIKRKR